MPDTSSPLGKIALLASLAAGCIAIYEWLANEECSVATSDLYGSSVCSMLGLGPTAATATNTTVGTPINTTTSGTTPIITAPSTPALPPGTPTAAQLTAWMVNSIGSPSATVSQWNWAMQILMNGENGTTGAPNPGPFVGPGVNLPGFTSATQVTTAAGYLGALAQYIAQGNTVPGLTGLHGAYAGFGAYWVPGARLHTGVF